MVTDERLKMWLSFWKAIVIAGVTGATATLIPTWINAQNQSREIEVNRAQNDSRLNIVKNEKEAEIRAKRLELEQNYVTSFLDKATEENVENRYRFTRVLAALTLDGELKTGWRALHEDAQKERNEKTERLEALKNETGKDVEAEIAKLKTELEASRNRKDSVSVTSTPLSQLNHTECPEGTTAMVSAMEAETPANSLIARLMSAFGRPFNIYVWCSSENRTPVGEAFLFQGGSDAPPERIPASKIRNATLDGFFVQPTIQFRRFDPK